MGTGMIEPAAAEPRGRVVPLRMVLPVRLEVLPPRPMVVHQRILVYGTWPPVLVPG